MTLKNGKVQYKKLNDTLPEWFFIYKQLQKCQKECYPDNQNLIKF